VIEKVQFGKILSHDCTEVNTLILTLYYSFPRYSFWRKLGEWYVREISISFLTIVYVSSFLKRLIENISSKYILYIMENGLFVSSVHTIPKESSGHLPLFQA
jgi:hypothetical protein